MTTQSNKSPHNGSKHKYWYLLFFNALKSLKLWKFNLEKYFFITYQNHPLLYHVCSMSKQISVFKANTWSTNDHDQFIWCQAQMAVKLDSR